MNAVVSRQFWVKAGPENVPLSNCNDISLGLAVTASLSSREPCKYLYRAP